MTIRGEGDIRCRELLVLFERENHAKLISLVFAVVSGGEREVFDGERCGLIGRLRR